MIFMAKDKSFLLRHDEDEKALWDKAARLDNRSLSQWMRLRLTQIAKEEIEKAKEKH